MRKFSYQAKTANGQLQNGTLEAEDEIEVRIRLKAKNLTPLRIIGSKNVLALQNANKKVKSRELQIFTRQFSTLINAGIPIVDCLTMLTEGARNPVLKEAAGRVKKLIEGGRKLGDAMATYPGVFDRLYVNMVRAGEEGGMLHTILQRLAIYMEKSEKLKSQIKGAMIYPIAIVIVAIAVVGGIFIFIIPKFQDMYKSSGKELPALTQFVVGISDYLIKEWYVVLAAMVAIPYLLYTYIQTPEGDEQFDNFMIRVPKAGELVQKAAIARMTRTLSTLLTSGVGVVEALEIAARTSGNRVIEAALMRSKESVISGKPLAAPLSKEEMIPQMVSQMIAIGEKSGSLDEMCAKIADFYEDDVENVVKALMSMIEPVLIVFLGGTVAFVVLAMYLPIFNMGDTVGG